MQERIIRFGLSGLTFLLSGFFGYWYFGGEIGKLDLLKSHAVITTIVAIFSTPIFGFIVSSFGSSFLMLYKFSLPPEEFKEEYFALLNKYFPNDFKSTLEPKKNIKIISTNHQVLFRQRANDEIMKFTCRRMDVCWQHVNTITSIILSLILSAFLVWYTTESKLDISWSKLCWIMPFVIYVVVGIWVARQDLIESNNFEKKFLIEEEVERTTKVESSKPSLAQRVFNAFFD